MPGHDDNRAGPRLRLAAPGEADRIAALHARSWRSAYRGIFSDAYLDGPIDEERRAVWRDRYAHPPAGLWTVLAESPGGDLLGFLCLLADHDPEWGTLIDNLHTDPQQKGRGTGRAMMAAAADHLRRDRPDGRIHLTVLEENRAARGFYERVGGQLVERSVKLEPDGGRHAILRFVWASPAALAEGMR